MSYYPEPNIQIRDKAKVALDFSNYATKNELNNALDVDTSNLKASRDFVGLKAEGDKLDINKLVNVRIGLNNSRTKVYEIDINKLKSVPVDLKNLSIKKLVYKKLNAKVNTLEEKSGCVYSNLDK